jgi:hypothetical protein
VKDPLPFKTGRGFSIRGKMNNVISLKDYKFNGAEYTRRIQNMHKVDLLEEMVNFTEEVQAHGYNTNIRNRGRILFNELILKSETPELRDLCNAQLKQLEQK